MKINRDNCEAYFLDYHEGQLSPEMAEEVLRFVKINPEFIKIFEEFETINIVADQNIVFSNKSTLKKNEVLNSAPVNELNYEEYLIGEAEGLLNKEELAELEQYINANPGLEKDRKLYSIAHLTPDYDIVFKAKDSLKKKVIPVGPIDAVTFETYLARELEDDLSQDERLQLAEFLQFNPHLENDRALYTKTHLQPDTEIVFENKRSLKRGITSTRRIVYYALSVAASITLLFSVYFALNRNNIPGDVAQQESIKEKINVIVPEPVTEIPQNQVAANYHPVAADKKPITTQPATDAKTLIKPDKSLIAANNQAPGEDVSFTRLPVESLQNIACSEVKSRQMVDPQFKFIRVSQMYMNTNLEFYYNIKLAEDLQYAQLNVKDKNPAKTIFTAATDKLADIFVSNRKTKHEEKNNLSVWTFAQLGVQTYNNLTQSDVELKLKKDDEGKVVGYGLESTGLNFNRDIRKPPEK